MSRKVVIDRTVLKYLSELPEKSQRLIKEKCYSLAENPFPGHGGDKELLHLEFKLYRLHVGRSFTTSSWRRMVNMRGFSRSRLSIIDEEGKLCSSEPVS